MKTPLALVVAAGLTSLASCSTRDTPSCAGPACVDPDASSPVDAGADAADATDAMDAGLDSTAPDAGSDAAEPDAGPSETYFYVFNVLDLGAPAPGGDPTVVPGFDLDDFVSAPSDNIGCYHEDYTSPPPDSESGVDNALGPILAELEDSLHFRAEMEARIATGDLLMLVELAGVHSFEDDPSGRVDLMFGLLPLGVVVPLLGTDGRLAPGQTFDVDLRSLGADGVTPRVRFDGASIVGGRVITGPGDVFLTIPYEDTSLVLAVESAEIRFNPSVSSLTHGVLGGQLDVDALVAAIVALDPVRFSEPLLRAVLESAADMEPDATETCTAVSIGFVFEAVPALRGVVALPGA